MYSTALSTATQGKNKKTKGQHGYIAIRAYAFPRKQKQDWKGRKNGDRRTGVDAVGVLVGNLDAKLLLNGHDDLDGVEAVEAEVVGEVGGGLDLLRVESGSG
jgi:hypothetical protein